VVILGLACVKVGEWVPSLRWLREADAVAALGVVEAAAPGAAGPEVMAAAGAVAAAAARRARNVTVASSSPRPSGPS